MVINTMGWIEDLGYELLLHSINTLKADVVLVVSQDRLYNQLRNHLRCCSIQLSTMCIHPLIAPVISSLDNLASATCWHLI